jgi:FtsP/CotA-like multicopper oxidase with cupredoxin domain
MTTPDPRPRLAKWLPAALLFVLPGFALRTHDPLPSPSSHATDDALPVVQANDNRTPAGTLRNGVLTLNIAVVRARWYPEAMNGPHVDLLVFAEEGKAPSIPGPLVRVPRGTRVRMTIRNTRTDSTIGLWGLGSTTSDTALVAVAPGASHLVEFTATHAGTFMYGARTTRLDSTDSETEQLAGAIVVDEPGARTDDRILVLNIWGELRPDSSFNNALAINGKSWPYTERFEVMQGDSLRWRVINPTVRQHPMHLHGAYFRVDARGDAHTDTLFSTARRRMAVTEQMEPHSTMRMTWSPATPGNWLFHCHLAFHVIASAARLDVPAGDEHEMHSADPDKHMAGLVIGIHVKPREAEPVRRNVQRLAVSVVRGAPKDTVHPRPIGVRLTPDGKAPAPSTVTPRGDMIVLTRGVPTDVVVHNALDEPTAIHWHGLELESYSDGVAGISGSGTRRAPAIAPGDSFVAHLTLKRAGTFIYHTHLNDLNQITAGLYGPIVVLEPGERWDPTRDLMLTAGFDVSRHEGPVVNGGDADAPLAMTVGRAVRIRMINIAPADPVTFELLRDSTVIQWRAVSKDGFALPRQQAVREKAQRALWVGETFDAEFLPDAPGTYYLRARAGPKDVLYTRELRVGARP